MVAAVQGSLVLNKVLDFVQVEQLSVAVAMQAVDSGDDRVG